MIPTRRETDYYAAYREPCTICETSSENTQPTVLFPRREHNTAHATCEAYIRPATAQLTSTIQTIFSKELSQHYTFNAYEAQRKAIEAVHRECEGKSILRYAETEGLQELTHLCNTVGIQAVHTAALTVIMERTTPQRTTLPTTYMLVPVTITSPL